MHVHIFNSTNIDIHIGMAEAASTIDKLSGRTIGRYVINQAHANRKRGRREWAFVSSSRGANFRIEIIR